MIDSRDTLRNAIRTGNTLSHTRFGQFLVDRGLLNLEQLEKALEKQRLEGFSKPLGQVISEQKMLAEDKVYSSLALMLGLPFIDLDKYPMDKKAAALVPQDVARRFHLLPVDLIDDVLVVATANPFSIEQLNQVRFLSDHVVEIALAQPSQIDYFISILYGPFDDPKLSQELADADAGYLKGAISTQQMEKLASQKPVVKLVYNIIADAIARSASDIHIRPREKQVDLYYRIDGSLIRIRSFGRQLLPAVVSRIKIMGLMDISEHRLPQDGRMKFQVGNRTVDLRLSTIPAIHGESVVIRILDTLTGLKALSDIGFSSHDEEIFSDLLTLNQGMLLVTGPTGSGKTTTLYAALQEARKRNVNIITVEEPVEYHIDGINQIQVNHGIQYTFGKALRHILRHDPDVIMVGEIRDEETAKMATECALTGHLVLSTLHTNSAATAITRLLEIGVPSYLINATLVGVLAQRLVRKNCQHCTAVENVSQHVRNMLGLGRDEIFYKGQGCSHCHDTGYQGRIACYELMVIQGEMRRHIHEQSIAEELESLAIASGMVPLTQQALSLAREHVTSIEEVHRIRLL